MNFVDNLDKLGKEGIEGENYKKLLNTSENWKGFFIGLDELDLVANYEEDRKEEEDYIDYLERLLDTVEKRVFFVNTLDEPKEAAFAVLETNRILRKQKEDRIRVRVIIEDIEVGAKPEYSSREQIERDLEDILENSIRDGIIRVSDVKEDRIRVRVTLLPLQL